MQVKKQFIHPLAGVLFTILPGLSQAATYIPNVSVPGIPAPGFPHFETTVDVTLTKYVNSGVTSYQLTAVNPTSGTFLFQYSPSSAYTVTGGSYQLTANFDASGNFVSQGSNVAVTGTISGYHDPGVAPTSTNLFTADLLGFGADVVPTPTTPVAVGILTGNFGGWAAQFGSEESIYLYNFNVPDLMTHFGVGKFRTTTYFGATAMTTVPIPAALWLFGSALAFLSFKRGKRSD